MFGAFDKIINPKYYKEYAYALAHEVSFDAKEYTFESFLNSMLNNAWMLQCTETLILYLFYP